MPYKFLDDVAIADIAFVAWARSLDRLFLACADATMHVMVTNLKSIAAQETKMVTVTADACDMLLFHFLQEIIFYKDSAMLLLRPSSIQIDGGGTEWKLKAQMYGEKLDPQRHDLRVDVKAVTLHRFCVEKKPRRWEAFVILDI